MLAARCARRVYVQATKRAFGTAGRVYPSKAYTDASSSGSPTAGTSGTPQDLTSEEKRVLDAALRVDQAGEVAANYIYMGQLAVLGRDRVCGPLIQEMWDQEKKHLSVMNKLQVQHNVRPTILTEVAKIAGFGLGAVTALMSKEAAMACTEAVETVIGEHYDDQLRDLNAMKTDHTSIPLLKKVIEEFRDDELEHLDAAVEHQLATCSGPCATQHNRRWRMQGRDRAV
ncbi:hypothetical protein NM688_g9236 [Phlebia brevispora]|uniref:Uncharacterized protein n=1 Tax=Phlebia brevispora TaxID=194682 RepID=A0ACC1RJD8_9APHY|nr:hypothetical protein NM688_g9236 [Phlebia brevispora]